MSVFADDQTQCKTSGVPSPTTKSVEDGLERKEETVGFRMPRNAPVYVDGVPAIVYLSDFSDWALFHGLPLTDWLLVFFQLLSGAPRAWMRIKMDQWAVSGERITCAKFRDVFLHRFLGSDWPQQVRTTLDEYTHDQAPDLHQFLSTYQELDSFVSDRCDRDRVHHLLSRLPADVQRFVRAKEPKAYADVLDAAFCFNPPARLTAQDLLGRSSMHVARGGVASSPGCAYPTSATPVFSPTVASPARHNDMDIDAVLARLEHLELQAVSKGGKGGRSGRGGDNATRGGKQGRGSGRPVTCFKCGGKGHMQAVCPSQDF